MDEEYVKKLVVARLNAMPPDISFSIGDHGDFTRDQLILEVERDTKVGKETVELELSFLKKMPTIAREIE